MRDPFELANPAGAQAYLHSFSTDLRSQGEAYVRRNAVSNFGVEAKVSRYFGTVTDGREFQVSIFSSEETSAWSAECSCDPKGGCAHVVAVLRVMLAEHSAALVRNLSAGLSVPPGHTLSRTSSKANAKAAPGELEHRLSAALGRPLNSEETGFLRKLQAVYTRCTRSTSITRWDFEEMGLRLGGYGWDVLQLWSKPPADEYDFWLHVANAALEAGIEMPKFMEAITGPDVLAERREQWRRGREIERWNLALKDVHLLCENVPPEDGEMELRLRVDEFDLRIESRRARHSTFELLKQSELQHLAKGFRNGTIRFGIESDLIWQIIAPRLQYSHIVQWRSLDSETTRLLGTLLRSRILEDRIVNASGLPLARPVEPLRWHLTPAESVDGDYTFQLQYPDGSPVTRLLAVLKGSKTLYLTPDAVFHGPPSPGRLLDFDKITSIPAPALEGANGVALLQSIGAELPPRLRERVRDLAFQLCIRCDLRSNTPIGAPEECVIGVVAEAEDGRRLTWSGYGWLDTTPRATLLRLQNEQWIVQYDRSLLNQTQFLLEPLNLRRDSYSENLILRVTRRFPELFAKWLKSMPPGVNVQLGGELESFVTADVAGRVSLEVTEVDIDWFDLRVVLKIEDATLSSEEMKLLLKAKGSYVRLSGKGWRRLQFDLSHDENERLAKLGLHAQELSAQPQRLHALQLADEAASRFLPEQQFEQVQRRAHEIKARVTPDLPATVLAQLRPYQIEGFHFLAYLATNRFGGILADDMGLGKTLQALAWLAWLRELPLSPSEGAKKGSLLERVASTVGSDSRPLALVVCPKSVMDNWRVEAARFTPVLRVRVWSGGEMEDFSAQLSEADLHVVNYVQLRLLGEGLKAVFWRCVILDEGQYIKNPSSQTAQIARALRAEYRLVLSGTPIENQLLDLWSLLSFAMPGVLGSRAHFAKHYNSKEDPFARMRLASRVRPFLLRRTKDQVAQDLPDRVEEDLFCEMEDEQRALYRAELKRAQQLMLGIKSPAEFAEQQFHFLVSLLRLRQICCHPKLHNADSKASSAKADAMVELLEPLMEKGEKVLVFSQFVELLDLLRPELENRQWPVFYLAGDTENRGELVREFQAAPGPAVFLISLKAGGFGLNLTAASYVVLFDPWWNPAVENQAIDRTHRIGQSNKVIAYRLLIKNSIEEKIRELQRKKKALAADVLGEERFSQSLTLTDLQFLLADDAA